MNSRTPSVLKNTLRAASGGVAVIIAIIALMFMKGGGTGDGDAEDEPSTPGSELISVENGSAGDSNDDTSDPSDADAAPDEDTDEEGGLTADEKQALSGDMLGILIREYSYSIVVPGDEETYQPVELERLLQLAQLTKGDSNGIRVKILRAESSRMKAEVDLKKALADVGIGEDAVYTPKELLPEQ